MVAGTVAVFLPMVLSLLLLLAVQWRGLDGVTRHAPQAVRSIVAQAIVRVNDTGDVKRSRARAEAIDSVSAKRAEVETPVMYRTSGSAGSRADLEQLYKHQREARVDATALAQRAKKLQEAGHGCEAEELYTRAASEDSSMEIYQYAEGVGRAGLQCGELPAARAGLEAAVLKQENFLKGTEEDQLTSVRRDMLKAREFLVVVYERQHESALATAVCSKAHPDWKRCACALDARGDVECKERL
jgi:hypothetical protein